MVTKFRNLLPLIVVAAASSLLFLTNLGRNTLADWDEAWYADASRFMFRHQHYLTPVWNNYYFFDKPPLQYWLTQPFLYIFGENEIAYRLPSALAAIGLTLITFIWARSIWGTSAGLAAATVLLSFPHFLDRGRSGNFDALFILLTTFSLYLYHQGKYFKSGIFLGLSWLTKGVFSGFFPLVVAGLFGFYDFFKHKSPSFFTFSIIMAAGALIVYAPWHLIEANRFEELIQKSYFATFDQGEFGDWSWSSIAWRFDLRYLVFLNTFLRWWFPIMLIAGLKELLDLNKDLLLNKPAKTKTFVSASLPIIAFLVVFLALSTAKEKNDWYIMPLYPFIAIMITGLFTKVLGKRFLVLIGILLISVSNLWFHKNQAFPPNKHLPEKQVALVVKDLTAPDEIFLTAEYEFPTLRYYSQREVRTSAPQQDYEGKYWWVWDSADIATALRHGQRIVTIHRPGTEWSIDIWGYRREKIGEINGRIISRIVLAGG
ncbi:glycosyltransferase family 39 protein [Candidatus Collierbacteria bacterium]|nr:glycosyltransferase family 39 protein [Candidatus Collierbacteria bacterium]